MKLLVASLSVLFSALAFAQPKIALVRVNDIYMSLPSTRLMHVQISKERAAIVENERNKQLKIHLEEMKEMEKKIQNNQKNLSKDATAQLIKEYELKRRETIALKTEYEKYQKTEEFRIRKQLVAATTASLKRITDAAEQIAKERNIDLVLDSSAVSNTHEELLLYTSNRNDITQDVVTLLGEIEQGPTPEQTPSTPVSEKPKEQ